VADFVPESTNSAAGADRLCQVKGCAVVMRRGQRVCQPHWAALPGDARKRLSMSRHGPIADAMWTKAVAVLEGQLA
jgi:hypothetical protein